MWNRKHIGFVITIIVILIVGLVIAFKLLPARNTTMKLLYPQSLEKSVQSLLDDYSGYSQNNEIEGIPYDGVLTAQLLKDADLVLLQYPLNAEITNWSEVFLPLDKLLTAEVGSMVLLPQEDSPLYIVPLCGEVPVALYNKQIFEKAGIVCPENINDFFKACSTLQLEGISPVMVRVDDAGQWDMLGMADSILTNSTEDTHGITVLAEDSNWISRDLEFVAGVLDGTVAPLEKSETASWMQGLLKGSYAMVLGSSTDAADIKDTSVLGCFPLFGVGTNDYIAWNTSLGMAINRKSYHTDEAEALIKYVLSSKIQKTINEETKQLPVIQNCTVFDGQRDIYQVMSQQQITVPSFFDSLSTEERQVCLRQISLLFQTKEMGNDDSDN